MPNFDGSVDAGADAAAPIVRETSSTRNIRDGNFRIIIICLVSKEVSASTAAESGIKECLGDGLLRSLFGLV